MKYMSDLFIYIYVCVCVPSYPAQTWTLLTPSGAPAPRTHHSAVVVGDRYLVVFGGDVSGAGEATEELWVYDRETNVWQQHIDSGPAARQQHAAAVLDDQLYVYGGQLSNFAVAGDLWRVDIAQLIGGGSAAWQRVEFDSRDEVIEARRQHSGAAAAGRIFFFGGQLASSDLTSDLLIFDPTDLSLVVYAAPLTVDGLTTMPVPLERRDSTLSGNLQGLYLFGGIGAAAGQLFNDVWEFNAVQLSWEQRAPVTAVQPSGRGLHSATLAYDQNLNRTRLLVYGGQDLVERSRQVWQYGVPDLVITFEEYLDCGEQETFFAPAGSLPSFDFDTGIFSIEYQCDGYVDCDNVYDEGFKCSPSVAGIYVAFSVLGKFSKCVQVLQVCGGSAPPVGFVGRRAHLRTHGGLLLARRFHWCADGSHLRVALGGALVQPGVCARIPLVCAAVAAGWSPRLWVHLLLLRPTDGRTMHRAGVAPSHRLHIHDGTAAGQDLPRDVRHEEGEQLSHGYHHQPGAVRLVLRPPAHRPDHLRCVDGRVHSECRTESGK
jgi:N-acetylneuraminic acid mutarotase